MSTFIGSLWKCRQVPDKKWKKLGDLSTLAAKIPTKSTIFNQKSTFFGPKRGVNVSQLWTFSSVDFLKRLWTSCQQFPDVRSSFGQKIWLFCRNWYKIVNYEFSWRTTFDRLIDAPNLGIYPWTWDFYSVERIRFLIEWFPDL